MLSNFFSIISKINNITSNNNKLAINTNLSNPLLNHSFKKNIDKYIAISNQKSFEIYSKYNTNSFSKFSVLDLNKKSETNIKKNINHAYIFIGCFYIFLASFAKNTSFIV
jgi:hypothetical protein